MVRVSKARPPLSGAFSAMLRPICWSVHWVQPQHLGLGWRKNRSKIVRRGFDTRTIDKSFEGVCNTIANDAYALLGQPPPSADGTPFVREWGMDSELSIWFEIHLSHLRFIWESSIRRRSFLSFANCFTWNIFAHHLPISIAADRQSLCWRLRLAALKAIERALLFLWLFHVA